MFRSAARGLGRFAGIMATAALLTSLSLFIVSAYLMTWPILRKSPREQRLAAATQLATASMSFLATLRPNDEPTDE